MTTANYGVWKFFGELKVWQIISDEANEMENSSESTGRSSVILLIDICEESF